MDAHTVMEEWEVSPFDGGFDGIRELRSGRFSGAVEAGTAWLFLRDGDPLAVVEDLEMEPRIGDIDAFEGASGRAHRAPHPAAASLAAMLALDGDVRGQYFTDDTSLSTVHETLSEGGFTGYVELSENVLSGDYYVVYEDGDEDRLGYVGSNNRLITDEEAESKAESEVGIYSVVAVGFPDVDVPSATAGGAGGAVDAGGGGATDTGTGGTADAGAGGATDADVTGTAGAGDVPSEDGGVSEPTSNSGEAVTPGPTPGAESGTESADDLEADDDPEPDTPTAAADTSEPEPEPVDESEPEPDPEPGHTSETDDVPEPDDEAESVAAGASGGIAEPHPGGGDADGTDGDESVLAGVTSRAVPSLDPDRTGRDESGQSSNYVRDTQQAQQATDPEPEPNAGAESTSTPEESRQADSEPASESEPAPEPADDERVEALREEYEGRIENLRSDLESLRSERDRLQERVRSLESAQSAGTAAAGPALSPAEALAGTSLFVREGTRGEATLEDAHAGRTDRETLEQNLHIEYHTQFEDDGATVDGEPFESWLRSSAPHEFVEWLIVELLFEIQSTGSESGMAHLYDAIPEIDRVGFDDTVTVGDGQEGREISFDVVARDRMGDPLVVASIDDSRDPTRADAMGPLIADAGDVCEAHDTLAGTFAVTSSYFEPDALDAAREATSGSLLGREKYRSYVKLARKNGFHLCLLESREGSFHLAAPEL